MPRLRPIGRITEPARAAVRLAAATVRPGHHGRAADLDLDPDDALRVVRTRPITDGSGWHFSVYDANDSKNRDRPLGVHARRRPARLLALGGEARPDRFCG